MSQRKDDEAKRQDTKNGSRLFRTSTYRKDLKQVMSPRPEDHEGFVASEPRYIPRPDDVIQKGKEPDAQIPDEVYKKEVSFKK